MAAAEIAPLRLQDDGGLDASRARLLGDHETKIRIGDDDWGGEQFVQRHPFEHLPERGQAADQRNEMFRHLFARDWPQSCAGAAAQDYRDDELIRHQYSISQARLNDPNLRMVECVCTPFLMFAVAQIR